MSTATWNDQRYRQPLWGRLDRVSRNCLLTAAGAGVAVLVAVVLAPQPPARELTIQEMPERFARLILAKPEPVTARVETEAPAAKPKRAAPAPEVARAETPPPRPAATRKRPDERRAEPKLAPDKGQQGRDKARTEVAANLQQVTGSLDQVLGKLSEALPAAGKTERERPRARRRQRGGVRGGRTATQLARVDNISNLSTAQVAESALATESVSIAAISGLEVAGDTGDRPGATAGTSAQGSTGGDNPIRSNQALLQVVRRYAPGIQFCYENELKKNPGLSGKLVVSLTVAPDGGVVGAVLVEDTLRSAAVTGCVLAQMNSWQFPAIEAGTVTFKTPFVFTPPK